MGFAFALQGFAGGNRQIRIGRVCSAALLAAELLSAAVFLIATSMPLAWRRPTAAKCGRDQSGQPVSSQVERESIPLPVPGDADRYA
jgi:hypothetical protein